MRTTFSRKPESLSVIAPSLRPSPASAASVLAGESSKFGKRKLDDEFRLSSTVSQHGSDEHHKHDPGVSTKRQFRGQFESMNEVYDPDAEDIEFERESLDDDEDEPEGDPKVDEDVEIDDAAKVHNREDVQFEIDEAAQKDGGHLKIDDATKDDGEDIDTDGAAEEDGEYVDIEYYSAQEDGEDDEDYDEAGEDGEDVERDDEAEENEVDREDDDGGDDEVGDAAEDEVDHEDDDGGDDEVDDAADEDEESVEIDGAADDDAEDDDVVILSSPARENVSHPASVNARPLEDGEGYEGEDVLMLSSTARVDIIYVSRPTSVNASGKVDKSSLLSGTIQTTGAPCSREEVLKKEEDSGRLRFVCHFNDGVDEHMVWLIDFKNIVSRQLPNLLKKYIVHLMMDRNHKSMMIIKDNNVVGGITYRPYRSQQFGEIAFCAIIAEEQGKGYGTRLMNHVKQHARDEDGLTHLLTYADNDAFGYFTKHGFTREIQLEKEKWEGYIKEYKEAKLMEYKIEPKFDYTDLAATFRIQHKAILEMIGKLSNFPAVYPGLEIPKTEAGVPLRPLKIEDIPGVKEAGWVPERGSKQIRLASDTFDGPPSQQSLNAFMRYLLRAVIEHADAWPFKEPVDAREADRYYEIIKDPMDLSTLSKRLDTEKFYLTLDIFTADMRRIFTNARRYNGTDTKYFKAANKLENFFNKKLKADIQRHSKPPAQRAE